MAIIKFPRFLGGNEIPEEKRYDETEVLRHVGQWLAQLGSEEEQFRVLAYWIWRLKSKDYPTVEAMMENVTEESAEKIGTRLGFDRARNDG
jgi:hypothetical protein